MLFFEYLTNLDPHIRLLQKKIKDKHTLFLVGWCVRDPLLGIDKKPRDIDLTMAGEPESLYAAIDKKGMSHFITEKYGTITLIDKPVKSIKSKVRKVSDEVTWWLSTWWPDDLVKYELTPLRTESDYADSRHPDQITRSNDLLLDSNRRDFTINCMYYTQIASSKEHSLLTPTKEIHKYSEELLIKRLDDHGYLMIQDLNLLIVQDHKHIAKLFTDGILQAPHLEIMLKSTPLFTLQKNSTSKIQHSKLSILIDPHKWIHDSIHRKLRTVGDPDKRFTEDALRIVRALRFVNVINEKLSFFHQDKKGGNMEIGKGEKKENKTKLFDFNKETWNSLKKNHALVKNVAKERIKEEIMKAFTFGNPFGFVALLDEAKLMAHLFPALERTKRIEQPIRYHPFDVYAHTLLTLFELQKISKNPLMRLAMLYHDVGKVEQFAAYGDNLSKEEIRAIISGPLNHRRSSPEYAKKDFKALGFSGKEIETIARYIANHHKPEELLMAKKENTEKKVRIFFSEAGYEKANDILDITIADRRGQYNPLQNSSDISDIYELKTILKKLQKQEGQFTMKDLAVNWADIIKQLKLKPSATIGILLKKALERVMSDIKIRNTKHEILTFLSVQLKQMGK